MKPFPDMLQVAFCHVHKLLPTILEQVKRVLAPGGVVIVNDYLGGDNGVSETTKEHVWKRLHFEYLHGDRSAKTTALSLNITRISIATWLRRTGTWPGRR